MNKIITISGADLVGKATQSKLLAKYLGATLFSFPDYTTVSGKMIESVLKNKVLSISNDNICTKHTVLKKEAYSFQCLNILNRLEKQKEIKEALTKGHVVCDRYDVDSLVYGVCDGCDNAWVENMLGCIVPSDLVIILNSPTLKRNEEKDINEKDIEFQKKVKQTYLEMANKYNWALVNNIVCTEGYMHKEIGISETQMKIRDVVEEYLNNEKKYHGMSLNEYQELAYKTGNNTLTQEEKMINYSMGLCGESGELIDHVKKHSFHKDRELDKDYLLKELGDILWYISQTAQTLGIDLETIAKTNLEKLERRYQGEFTPEKSKNRVE